MDNITDWALVQFRTRYAEEAPDLAEDDIFAYVYAVLHDPVYRETYAADLRREFPRVPLYAHFTQWVAWGRTLLDLHIGYEGVAPFFGLTQIDVPTGKPPVAKLKSLPAPATDRPRQRHAADRGADGGMGLSPRATAARWTGCSTSTEREEDEGATESRACSTPIASPTSRAARDGSTARAGGDGQRLSPSRSSRR